MDFRTDLGPGETFEVSARFPGRVTPAMSTTLAIACGDICFNTICRNTCQGCGYPKVE